MRTQFPSLAHSHRRVDTKRQLQQRALSSRWSRNGLASTQRRTLASNSASLRSMMAAATAKSDVKSTFVVTVVVVVDALVFVAFDVGAKTISSLSSAAALVVREGNANSDLYAAPDAAA